MAITRSRVKHAGYSQEPASRRRRFDSATAQLIDGAVTDARPDESIEAAHLFFGAALLGQLPLAIFIPHNADALAGNGSGDLLLGCRIRTASHFAGSLLGELAGLVGRDVAVRANLESLALAAALAIPERIGD
jgi:hypothetical protein